MLGWNYAISPTTILNVNGSISRFHYLRGPINQNFDMTAGRLAGCVQRARAQHRANAADALLRPERLTGGLQPGTKLDQRSQHSVQHFAAGHDDSGSPHFRMGRPTRRRLRQLPADQHRRRSDLLHRIVDICFPRRRSERATSQVRATTAKTSPTSCWDTATAKVLPSATRPLDRS